LFGCRQVAVTLRPSTSAGENGWSAVLFDAPTKTFLQSQRYTVRLVDRIGGGDSFAAGLIHGFVSGRDLEATLQFAVAASALKQQSGGAARRNGDPDQRRDRGGRVTRL
jgi:2-dehydro-3-deoxygluconokinase